MLHVVLFIILRMFVPSRKLNQACKSSRKFYVGHLIKTSVLREFSIRYVQFWLLDLLKLEFLKGLYSSRLFFWCVLITCFEQALLGTRGAEDNYLLQNVFIWTEIVSEVWWKQPFQFKPFNRTCTLRFASCFVARSLYKNLNFGVIFESKAQKRGALNRIVFNLINWAKLLNCCFKILATLKWNSVLVYNSGQTLTLLQRSFKIWKF